jgi:low affinity Fe/Cu permease
MVFLIQNTQNRDAKAIHLKLDELLKGVEGARTSMVDLEDLPDAELKRLQHEFRALREQQAAMAREHEALEREHDALALEHDALERGLITLHPELEQPADSANKPDADKQD